VVASCPRLRFSNLALIFKSRAHDFTAALEATAVLAGLLHSQDFERAHFAHKNASGAIGAPPSLRSTIVRLHANRLLLLVTAKLAHSA